MNLKYRVIHISNEFEEYTGYKRSDFGHRGIQLLFTDNAAEELIQGLDSDTDLIFALNSAYLALSKPCLSKSTSRFKI